MKEKTLKSSTIIPSHLYVERGADRQIRSILSDMGRPGYILVARQLGKTNLLLNTKRSMENKECIFVYVDLSTIFDDERDCFRNIVDIAIDTNEGNLGDIRDQILKIRDGDKYPPQKEHELELRALLNSIPGKLVIFLDEIDALSNVKFSDKVFAQIRSIYFTRVNYTEYDRLTYILSGVLEPSEIINNKNISPFNIGEKIYLNDFSYQEYEDFLGKLGFDLSSDVIERVYYWTGGNPRITWDVLSRIENKLIENESITLGVVDKIVKRLYLKDFDHAPIDHIRDLVENDKNIRDAVNVVKYGKGNTLSDDVKRKLYLAGIIKSDFSSKEILFKNEVISQSLSDEWLKEIESRGKSKLDLANEKFGEGKYQDAVSLYQDYLKEDDFDKKTEHLYYYNMGFCCYRINDFEKALEYFLIFPFDKKGFASSYFHSKYLIGICQFYVKNYESSLESFSELVNDDRFGPYYFESLLNLAGTYSKIDHKNHKNKIIELNEKVLIELEDPECLVSTDGINNIKTTAYYNLGKVYASSGDSKNANHSYGKASLVCDLQSKPRILFELYRQEDLESKKIVILEDIVKTVVKDCLIPSELTIEEPIKFDHNVNYNILSELFLKDMKTVFSNYCDYNLQNIFTDQRQYELLSGIGTFLVLSNRVEDSRKVILYLLDNFSDTIDDQDFLYDWYRWCTQYFDVEKYREKYFEAFKTRYADTFNQVDLQIFSNEIYRLFDSEKYSDSLQLISITYHYYEDFDEDKKIDYALVMYFEFMIYRSVSDKVNAIAQAEILIDFINSKQPMSADDSLLEKKQIQIILKEAKDFFNSSVKREPVRLATPKIGRNQYVQVKYYDGTIKKMKYKRVIQSIKKGDCTLVQ